MKCPSCSHASTVLETRTTKLGLRRRRRCLRAECGRKWSTIEVPVPSDRQHDDARVIIVASSRAAALRAAAQDLDEPLGGEQ